MVTSSTYVRSKVMDCSLLHSLLSCSVNRYSRTCKEIMGLILLKEVIRTLELQEIVCPKIPWRNCSTPYPPELIGIQTIYLLNHPFFLGSGVGSGAWALLKNLSDESSSLTYQKYWAIGIMNEPTTSTAIKAVYFPVILRWDGVTGDG